MNLAAYIPFSLAFIMFAMGLSLQIVDFKRIIEYPKAMVLGLACQILLLPLLAWLIASALSLNPLLSTGLLLIALCPGGVTSNLASHLAKGNNALSVSLTAVSSVITVFTLPLFMVLLADTSNNNVSLPLLPAIKQLATMTILPLCLGMGINHLANGLVQRHLNKITLLAALLFCLMIASVWYQQWDNIRFSAVEAGVAVTLLNLIALLLGWWLAKTAKLQQAEQLTLSLEVGLQNSALAVFVAVNMIGNGQLAIPASVYSVIMVCSAVSVIIIGRIQTARINRDPTAQISNP
ncbi:MAG TPA: bile acid:sodium symporter family protein [Porticoccus sp.]|nr:bile acid:sodium symporter family protein [Porticoccus sp.]